MGFAACIPPPPLSRLVASIWHYDAAPAAHALERMMPSPQAALIINLHEDEQRLYEGANAQRVQRYPGTILVGPTSRSFVIDTAEQIAVMGVQFQPGGAHPLFGERLDLLRDQHVGLGDVIGAEGARLRERLLDLNDAASRLALLQRWLWQRVRRFELPPAIAHALQAFRRVPAMEPVAAVTRRIGLPERRFRNLFSEHVGMSPKRYCRVVRFQAVVAHVHAQPIVDWASLALDFGYHDQAHFAHDFRAFAGLTASSYFAQRGAHPNHVPVVVT
jgi:AraC-like DNA-binding protein